MINLRFLLRIFKRKTKEERKKAKIVRAKKIYKHDSKDLALAILNIEEVNKIKNPEEYYRRTIEICAEHKLNWEIPN